MPPEPKWGALPEIKALVTLLYKSLVDDMYFRIFRQVKC